MSAKLDQGSRRLVLAVLVLVALVAATTTGALAQQRRFVTLASGWVVGVYYPLAGAMSRIVYNANLGIRLTVESSGASAANAGLIGSGDADLAILQNDIAHYAFNGTTLERFDGKPVKNIRGVMGLHNEPVQLVAREAAGIKTVADLRGKRVAVGPLGSGTEANAAQFLEAYGLRFADLGRTERIGAAEASDFLKDGRIDAAFYTVGVGAAAIQDVAVVTPVTIVALPDDRLNQLRQKYPFYVREVIPSGTYAGVKQDVPTASVRAIMVARAELEEKIVYDIVRAIFNDLKTFYTAHAAAKQVTLQNTLDGLPVPLHPGAERFFKEAGVLR
jgi:uncharacterized protein